MWNLTITNPDSEPLQIKLKPGKMLIGRRPTSDIVITDNAASRRHAEIYLDSVSETATIIDLKSSNGTYVNHKKISGVFRLQNDDVIRIGQTVMHLEWIANDQTVELGISDTRMFNRELVLEAVEENPILLFELTEKLNTVTDLDSVISLLTELTKRALGVDICRIILAKDFKSIDSDVPDDILVRTLRSSAVEVTPLAMGVPIVGAGVPLGIIHLVRSRSGSHPFTKREMQLAVAVSHQAALAIQRMTLMEKVTKEQQMRQLLLRFVSPIEAEYGLKDYLKTGTLPDLEEKKVTVLFVEIADATRFASRIGPDSFSGFLNAFYQHTTQVVFKNGGMVKYLGDGVLAVFMETHDHIGPEERAVRVALEVGEQVKRINLPQPELACVIGVAINTGNAMVGYAGTQERTEFNVMGDLIKMTYRMQEYAQPNRIFVGPLTAEAIRNRYLVQKVGSLAMKWHKEPVEVFEVSLPKVSPFLPHKEVDLAVAFKEVAVKLKTHKNPRKEE